MTIETVKIQEHSYLVNGTMLAPNDPANSDYQAILDWINEGNTPTGDIPTELQTAADAKQFAQQLADYTSATARLAQYVLSVGRAEVTENLATGEQVFNEETMEMDDVMADVVIVTAIYPVESQIELTYNRDEGVPTTTTVTNPLITNDEAERADAQAIVDATPQSVIDTYNEGIE